MLGLFCGRADTDVVLDVVVMLLPSMPTMLPAVNFPAHHQHHQSKDKPAVIINCNVMAVPNATDEDQQEEQQHQQQPRTVERRDY